MQPANTYYVASGFREDVRTIITKFVENDPSEFQSFVEIWNDMKFNSMFSLSSGRRSREEFFEFFEEAVDISKQFFSPVQMFKERIAGIYLVYAVYSCMPTPGIIRMTLTEWENLLRFQPELNEAKQYDALYILQKLVDENAFAHCILEHERGLENYYVLKDFIRGNPRSAPSVTKEIEFKNILDNVKNQSQSYTKLRDKYEKIHGIPLSKNFTYKEIILKSTKNINNTNNVEEISHPSTRSFITSTESNTTEPSTSSNNDNDSLPYIIEDSSDESESSDEFDYTDFD